MSCQNFKAKNVNCQGEEIIDKNEEIGGIISITFTDYPICKEEENYKNLPKFRIFINQEYDNNTKTKN
jgi:hypothetical protein